VFPIWDEGDLEIGAAPDDQESANPLGGDTLEAEAGAGQPDAPLSLLDRCRAGERPLDEIQSLTRQDRELLFASLGYIIKTEPALGDPCFEPERSRWKRDF